MAMNTNALLVEQAQICCGFVPVNLATAANPGDWISMKNFERLTVIFFAAAGTNGEDPTLTLEQATAVAGTSAKALNFTRIDTKQGADLFAIGTFTTVTQSAANTYTNTDAAENQKIWVVDVKAEDLDVDNGFDCVRASISDVGTSAQIGALLYIAWGAQYAPPLTAIAD
jgi:hypothetical protein